MCEHSFSQVFQSFMLKYANETYPLKKFRTDIWTKITKCAFFLDHFGPKKKTCYGSKIAPDLKSRVASPLKYTILILYDAANSMTTPGVS